MHKRTHILVTSLLMLLVSVSFPIVADDSEPESTALIALDAQHKIKLKELAFGEILFDYYQENYFSALTRLDVAEQRAEVLEHKQHLKLLRGVMYLSYGMLESAEQIFVELLEQSSLSENQQSAKLAQVRFYLAKTYYLNDRLEEAKHHMSIAFQHLPVTLIDEALLIRSQLAFRENNIEQSKQLLKQIDSSSKQGRYAQFNLAVFMLQNNDTEGAIELFETLYPTENADEVSQSLFDRANLALGYYFLENKQSEKAKQYLQKVRLDGPYSNRSILSLGWAFYESDNLTKAIAYWQALLERDGRDPAVQEAAMALAFAYYRNGAKKEALEAFVTAAALYGEQLTLIDNARQDLKGALFQRWLDSRGIFGEQVFQRWGQGDVPVTGHAIEYYLQDVVSENQFNQFFQRFQEMSHLKRVLGEWSRQLPVFEQMLSNHQQRYQNLKPIVDKKSSELLSSELQEKYNTLQKQIKKQQKQDDIWLLANAEELELYNDLMALKSSIEKVDAQSTDNPSFDMSEQKEQWRRVYGALLWSIAERYGPKHYRLTSELEAAGKALEQLAVRRTSLQSADSRASVRFLNYDARINQLQRRIEDLIAEVNINLDVSSQSMEQVLIKKLEKRTQELDFLLAQTELSIAKIQDEAISRMLEQPQ